MTHAHDEDENMLAEIPAMTTPALNEAGIEACPFCGRGDPELQLSGFGDPEWVNFCCRSCAATNGASKDKETAIAAWNRRALTASKEPGQEPVAWLHEIAEPDATRPMTMLSRSKENPWSHWMAADRDKCTYVATPLYATPIPAKADALMVERLWQTLIDKDDRNSSAEYPEMALITFDEFAEAVAAGAALEASMGGAETGMAIADIAAERRRQIEAEGWTSEHDDQHADGSLAAVAAAYAEPHPLLKRAGDWLVPANWPLSWHFRFWKPTKRRRDLVKAGALIVAEIDRLDRLDAPVGERK